MKLEDRVAVVTGAGQGIGRAYAHRLVEEGARVVVAELNEAKGKAVAEECLAAGGQAIFVRTDVADETSCREMVATTVRQFGRLDVLVNNAAIFSTITMKPFWEIGQAEWDELMAVNVRGVWLASKAVVPQMRQQRSGRIINISSAAIFMGRPNYLHYIASKGAVFAMTRAMAPEQRETMLRAQCIKRPEEPRDLVGTVVFLASDDAAFITGQTITVNGGLTFY